LLVSFLAGILLLASCLKDKVGDYWPSEVAGKMYATVPLFTLNSFSLAPVAGDQPFSFLVNIASAIAPTQDVTLTLAIDPAGVTLYNTIHGTSYQNYANAQVLTPTVVIPKGTRNDTIKAKVWGADLANACSSYMTAVTIKSAKMADGTSIPIASNMQSYYLSLAVTNPLAGNYHCVGYRIRPGNATEPVDQIEAASTVNCSTIQKVGFGNYMTYSIKIETTTNTIVVGGTTCYKVNATPVDATGNIVGGMFTTWTGDATLTPADLTINYYNPVKKVFILNCYYNSSAGNRIMYEVLTRQ